MTVHNKISLFRNASRLFCVGLLAVFCLLPVFSPVMAEDILERPDGTVYTDETTGYKVEIHDDASLLEDSQLHALAKEMKGLTQYWIMNIRIEKSTLSIIVLNSVSNATQG